MFETVLCLNLLITFGYIYCREKHNNKDKQTATRKFTPRFKHRVQGEWIQCVVRTRGRILDSLTLYEAANETQ